MQPSPYCQPGMAAGAIQLLAEILLDDVCAASIWTCDLDRLAREEAGILFALSGDERQYAERFRSDLHRSRYLATRYFERQSLGAALDVPPREVQIHRTPRGKPFVPGSRLHYSLSHDEHLAMLALGHCELGIDVEHLRELPDVDSLARQFLPVPAATLIQQLPPEEHSAAFLECWTACEAVLKASGEGLDGIKELHFPPGQESHLIAGGAHWRVYSFCPSAQVIAAIAIGDDFPAG